MPFILGKTLGKALGSVHLAALWGMLLAAPKSLYKNAIRAGFASGPGLGEELFGQILDHPEGVWAGKIDPENNFAEVKTEDGRINLFIPELLDELKAIEAAREEQIDSAVFGFDLGKVVFRIDLSRPDAFGMIENLLKQFFARPGPDVKPARTAFLYSDLGAASSMPQSAAR